MPGNPDRVDRRTEQSHDDTLCLQSNTVTDLGSAGIPIAEPHIHGNSQRHAVHHRYPKRHPSAQHLDANSNRDRNAARDPDSHGTNQRIAVSNPQPDSDRNAHNDRELNRNRDSVGDSDTEPDA